MIFISNNENKHTREDLKVLQSLPLGEKVNVTITRLIEYYTHFDNQCYVSFSGGKDSTVLAYIAAQVCVTLGCKLTLWFSDTGLEFPEIKQHVKSFDKFLKERFPTLEVETIIDHPIDRKGNRISFRDVIEKYGYPVISKEVAQKIYEYRNKPNGCAAERFDENSEYNTKYKNRYSLARWKWLRDSNIPISHMCCNVLKKNVSKKFENQYKLHPVIGSMACESRIRKSHWIKDGCNAFNAKRPTSQPLSFWNEQDILSYIVQENIPIASVYGEIVENIGGGIPQQGATAQAVYTVCLAAI